ncbi:hypothetical protein [Pseudonocardia lacus]|nr:hypothetical protein [Pseudonocardia lacus]
MDTINLVGAVLGLAVLLVMALTPLLLALPERPHRRSPSRGAA